MEAFTITFCDQGENNIGQLASDGFTFNELQSIHDRLQRHGLITQLFDLGEHLPREYGSERAGLLIIRRGVNFITNGSELLMELQRLDFDKQILLYGQVKERLGKYSLCFDSTNQKANYAAGEGTVVAFDQVPGLSNVRRYLPVLLNQKATNLVAEVDHYYDLTKCGTRFHGKMEKKIVVGIHLGESHPLCYYWHLGKERISKRIDFNLHHGDIYIMDEKACGHNYKKRTFPTLRHAVGAPKYIK